MNVGFRPLTDVTGLLGEVLGFRHKRLHGSVYCSRPLRSSAELGLVAVTGRSVPSTVRNFGRIRMTRNMTLAARTIAERGRPCGRTPARMFRRFSELRAGLDFMLRKMIPRPPSFPARFVRR